MEPLTDVTAYLWGRLPLILLFVCGYLVYQLMAATRITDGFVAWALRRSKGHPRRILFYIIAASAALSSFIPNTITVLTLIPVLKRLDRDFADRGVTGMTTVLMCSAIYGAAIGGMGSMIGSPANAVLFAALDLFEVAGRDNLNFFNWFLWSVPLVAAFVLVAWGVAAGLGLPGAARGAVIDVSGPGRSGADARQRYGAKLFWLYMGYFVLDAVVRENVAGFAAVSPVVSLGFAGLFLYLLFILALAVLVGVVHWTGLDHKTVVLAGRLLEGDMDPRLLFLLTITAVVLLTEVLSNTAVVAAFFTIAFYAAKGHGMDPLPLMIAVGVASTCAFMTPIATTSNALAFGEMKGASLRGMLGLGLVLNILGALLMTGWLSWILPRLY